MNTTALPNMLDSDPTTIALEDIDISHIDLWKNDSKWPFFKRLRDEAPVHYCRNSEYGAFWSITRFDDIMAVERNWEVFSSYPRISIGDPVEGSTFSTSTFIAMDPPTHDEQRKTVQGAVAPPNLKKLEATIRQRAGAILDSLPVGESFNWVDKVSVELTTQMLATLFDFPFEDRSKLTRWSDIVFARLDEGIIESHQQRQEELMECLAYFTRLWKEREHNPVGTDFISMMIRGDATRHLSPQEYFCLSLIHI